MTDQLSRIVSRRRISTRTRLSIFILIPTSAFLILVILLLISSTDQTCLTVVYKVEIVQIDFHLLIRRVHVEQNGGIGVFGGNFLVINQNFHLLEAGRTGAALVATSRRRRRRVFASLGSKQIGDHDFVLL